MKNFLQEHAMTLVYVIIGVALISTFSLFIFSNSKYDEAVPDGAQEQSEKIQVSQLEGPVLEVASGRVRLGEKFEPLDFVIKAEDASGRDLKDKVKCTKAEDVDITKEGIYKVEYTLMDENYMVARKEASFLVD